MSGTAADVAPQIVWQGQYVTAITEGRWEYVNRARNIRAAVILAIDDAPDGRHIILVEQYRVPLHRHCIELPAGLVGDEEAGEAASIAAARELEEETGYRAENWQEAGEFCSSPGMVGESFTLMIARDLTRIGPGGGVSNEDIIVHRVPLSGITEFLEAQRALGRAIDVRLTMLLAPAWLAQ